MDFKKKSVVCKSFTNHFMATLNVIVFCFFLQVNTSKRSPQLTSVFDSWNHERLWIFQHHKFSLGHFLTSYAHNANKNRPRLRNARHISVITECYIPGSERSVPLSIHTHLHTLLSGRTWPGKSLLASVWFSANRLFITLWLTIHLHF